jgi:glycosyltransferase involved in cell wall biosynthesis
MILVSAIMPTRGRQKWAAQAVRCFLAQTYPCRELIVWDDADDPSFPDGLPADGHVEYVRETARLKISQKRNRCAGMALGDVILHWDSDDWSAPERMADQVVRLEETGKAVTAYHAMYFYDEATDRAYRYRGAKGVGIGTSLAYLQTWWTGHPFDERLDTEEDNRFLRQAEAQHQLITADADRLMVARIHAGNTAPKQTASVPYRPAPRGDLPKAFFQ